jgi:prophage regulatory protein
MSAIDTQSLTTKKERIRSTQPLAAAQLADALLTLKTAGAVAGMSEDTIYRKAKTDPSFPKLIRIGARCTRIRAGDLTAWLNSLGQSAQTTTTK